MKFRGLLTIIAGALLFACSSSSDDVEEIPPVAGFELEEKIIGKWDVANSNPDDKFRDKQSLSGCYIYSLIFHADGTFIINYEGGTVTGEYTVESENLINLGDAGSLGDIRFSSTSILSSIELKNICSRSITAIPDVDYEPGNCSTFLHCHNASYWMSTQDEEVTFINFKNFPSEELFVRTSFFTSRNCKLRLGSNDEQTTSVVISNNSKELEIIIEEEEEEEESLRIYSYRVLENGKLQEEIETPEETSIRIFEPVLQNDMDPYADYLRCGEKTYVPDDFFEKELIRWGYDDVLDNYVLTENINGIERLFIGDFHNYPDKELLGSLTGLQDFTALKDLEIQVVDLAEIDLSGNINLERLFLGSPALTNLDLSQNKKLRSLYFEFAKTTTLDLSNNTELIGVELQLLPLTFLDISKNTKLEMLTIEGGSFEKLIAQEITTLWHLNLGNNEVEQLNVHYFPNLKELIADGNNLAAIDVSTLEALELLQVYDNNLTALDVSNNELLREMHASNNPALNCIQVAQVQLDKMEDDSIYMWWSKDETAEYSLDCQY